MEGGEGGFDNLPKIHDTLTQNLPTEKDSTGLQVDFDALLNQKRGLEAQAGRVDNTLLIRVINRFDIDKLNLVHSEVMRRLQAETNFLHQYEEIGVLDALVSEFGGGMIGDVKVKFSPEKRGQSGNWYWPGPNRIEITDDPVYKLPTLISLATEGHFPDSAQSLTHEVSHRSQYQDNAFKRTLSIISGRVVEDAPAESHSIISSSPEAKTRLDIVNTVLKSNMTQNLATGEMVEIKKNSYDTNKDKLIMAAKLVSELNALGFSTKEIGKILQENRQWDSKEATYSGVQAVIDQRMVELGLSEDGLNTLVDADRIEREIESLKVKLITQQEVAKVSSEVQKKLGANKMPKAA